MFVKSLVIAVLLGSASTAGATMITSLPGGQSAGIPVANEMTNGPRVFGPSPTQQIVYTATQNMAVYGWTGSYSSDSLDWLAGGSPIIGNNIYEPSTVTLRFVTPLYGFLAEMNWERRFGTVVTFAALDILGNDIEVVTLNDGTGVITSQLQPTGGSYGIGHTTNDIYGLRISNGALGIRNLRIASGPIAVTPVPEPAAWAMMMAGVGLIGFGLRRRQTVRVTDAG